MASQPDAAPLVDKGFASKPFERSLSEQGITLLRPSMKREATRPGEPMLKKARQTQRVLALTASISHNFQTG